ncbi:MAG: lysozyme inhibitor [Rhodospirillales bacterium]|nr:lysozyme inhibitor [Rhodospirillales bacterium]
MKSRVHRFRSQMNSSNRSSFLLVVSFITLLALPTFGERIARAEPDALPPVLDHVFVCEHGLELRVAFHTVDPQHVIIVNGRRTIDLPQVESASGARYSDGVTTFWNRGDQATLEWANGSTLCRVRQ